MSLIDFKNVHVIMQEAQFTVCLNKIWNKDLILTIDFEEHS